MITPDTEPRLRALLTRFLEETALLNLTALRTEEACWIGNILDSLAFVEIAERLKLADDASLIDVGTGGGFPLLPLAIALPSMRYVGLDSIKKKIDAVGRIASSLNIKNVTLIAERSEVLGHKKEHRERYDVAVSRAVAPLAILLEFVTPFVKEGGHAVLWKSVHIDDEWEASKNAQEVLGMRLVKKHRYTLPGDFGERQLLVFEKIGTLSAMYPRDVGEAKKSPL